MKPRVTSHHRKCASSVRQFYEEFDMSRAKFYRLVKAGKVRAVRIGGSTKVLGEDVERFKQSLQLV